jgi:competence CoiA-like predicted nuclease
MVKLKDIILPEFSQTKRIDEQWALVFDSDSQYDIIFGRDFLLNIGLDTCFSTRTTNWLDQKLPMKKSKFWEDPVLMYLALEPYVEEFERKENECKCITSLSSIKDAKYEKVNTKEVAANQSHLMQQQRDDLARVLAKHETLFDGTLGKYPHKKIHLELPVRAEPVHQKAYPVTHAHQAAFQKELLHLVEIGVLERCGAT